MDRRNIQGRIAHELLKIRRQISEMNPAEHGTAHIDYSGPIMDCGTVARSEFASGQAEFVYSSGIPEHHLETQLRDRVIELGLTNNELLQELAEKRRREEELKNEFVAREAALEKNTSALEQEVASLRLEIERLGKIAKDAATNGEKARLERQKKELLAKLEISEAAKDELAAKLEQGEKEKEKLSGKLNNAQKSNAELLDKLQSVEQMNTELMDKLQTVEQMNTDIQIKLQETEENLAEADSLRKQAEYNELELKQKTGETEEENSRLRVQLSEFKKVVQELKRKVSHQETRMKERLSHLKKANSELRHEIMSRMQAGEHLTPPTEYDDSDEAVIEMTVDGIILGWNRSAEILCGYAADEVKGFPVSILVPRKSYDDFQKVIKQIKDGANEMACKTVFVKKDGDQLKVRVTSTAITDEKGMLIGITCKASDD